MVVARVTEVDITPEVNVCTVEDPIEMIEPAFNQMQVQTTIGVDFSRWSADAGAVLGLILGDGLSWVGGHYRFIHLDASVYSIDYLPFAPRFVDAVIVAAVSLGVSLIATLYPSASAARVLPAEALRYE